METRAVGAEFKWGNFKNIDRRFASRMLSVLAMSAPNLRVALEQNLRYEFKDLELITEALTHKSYHHEHRSRSHNERLEFLGDTFVNLCVSDYLMRTSPGLSEGQLSKLRSQIISERGLSQVARKLGLGNFVLLGRGEELSGGRERESLLADTIEAVFAAVFLDAGFDVARRVLIEAFELGAETITNRQAKEIIKRDHKSRLQEMCQGLNLGTPVYRCLDTEGPDHLKAFTMGVYLQSAEIGQATATTKKLATQLAAEIVLKSCKTAKQLKSYLRNKGVAVNAKEEKSNEPCLL